MSTTPLSIPYSDTLFGRVPTAKYLHIKARWIMLDPADFERRANVANNTTSAFVACQDCHGYNYPEFLDTWDRIKWLWLCTSCVRKRLNRDGVPPHTCTGCQWCADPRREYERLCVHDTPVAQPPECPGQ